MDIKCPNCENVYTLKQCGIVVKGKLQATITCICGKQFDVHIKKGWFKNKIKTEKRI